MTGPAPIRMIQVGAGGMGQVWLELLTQTADVELVGLVDLDLDLAKRALAAVGKASVPVATSVSELQSSNVGADAVINVTIPAAHHSVTTEALFQGLHVLSEKPVAPTVSSALSLAAASEVSGRLLMTSQSRRYYATLRNFRELIVGLGTLGMASTEFSLAPRFGGFRDEMAHPLLVDMAIHPFDAARYALGANPVSVLCESSNPPWSWYAGDAVATAIFEFEGGIRYVYNGSWCSDGFQTSWNGSWRVTGEKGTAVWDGESSPSWESGEAAVDDPATPMERADDHEATSGETIAGALEEFIDAIRTGRTPSGEVHSNIISLAMVEAAVLSAESGTRVRIDDVLESSYKTALEVEKSEEVRARLESWGSASRGLHQGH
ncbi:Gfo/Idh/MocA family protein [Arthrobacter psychrochitiniphilus]|uniref:Gfo/Idh/MocA family protein n=1 Tax=Arthrobacter psychrochitiniphilus TaxID=291045 RepID=UPI003F7CAD1F